METNRFVTAQWYDAIYADVPGYDEVPRRIDALARTAASDAARTLLDVACGTGRFLASMRDLGYAVTGTDIDPGMLAIAGERLPGVELIEADMATMSLGRRFDVVTVLGSALPGVGGVEALGPAVFNLAKHLKPGGVMIVEEFIRPDRWEEGRLGADFVDRPGLKIARMVRSSRRNDIAVMDMHYLVATGEGTQQFVERHELGLYTEDDWRAAFRNAGLHAEPAESGLLSRPAWVARHLVL
jgi:SAM-dependent methyltransferase